MNILSPFTREFWIIDEDVRKAVGRLPTRDAVRQARCSAIALENERAYWRAELESAQGRATEARDELSKIDELEATSHG